MPHYLEEGQNLTVHSVNEHNIQFVDDLGGIWEFERERHESPAPDAGAYYEQGITHPEQASQFPLESEVTSEQAVALSQFIRIEDIPLDAIREVVNYMYAEELKSYEEEHGENSANDDILNPDHIFSAVVDLDTFATDLDESTPDEEAWPHTEPPSQWAEAIANRIADEHTGTDVIEDNEGHSKELLLTALEQAFTRCPDLMLPLIGTCIIEEDHFTPLD